MIFRKVALERLSSPEQLDQLMQVTNPRGWLALTALIAWILAVVVWSFVGSVPTMATGEGILIRRGGVSDLVATGSGQVEEVLVAVGDPIAKGQTVATIRQDGLLRQIDDAEARKAAVDAEYRDLLSFADEQRRLSQRNLEQERANLERSIATLERQVQLLEERAEAERELLRDGLITQQAVLDIEQEINSVRDQLASERLDLNGLELRRLEEDQQIEQQIETRRAELRDLELQLAELTASLRENVSVVSPHDGRVLELMVDRGDVVAPGDPVLTLEISSEELMAVLYVPADLGKQIQPGMEVRVSPSNVKREEYGFILGEVSWAAEFPSTSRGMVRLLANEELVSKLMLEGPPIQVDVSLGRDLETPTGYRWSSSTGPDLAITSGTLTSGSVIIKEERPISLVIPKIRGTVGG